MISFTSEDQKIRLYIFYYAGQVTDLKMNADRNLIDCNMMWINQINRASGCDLYASEEINYFFLVRFQGRIQYFIQFNFMRSKLTVFSYFL